MAYKEHPVNEMIQQSFRDVREAKQWVNENTDYALFEDTDAVVAVDQRGSVYRLRMNSACQHYWQRMSSTN